MICGTPFLFQVIEVEEELLFSPVGDSHEVEKENVEMDELDKEKVSFTETEFFLATSQ